MDKRRTCSQIKSFRKCHMKHFLGYVLGIRPAEQAKYFRFGGVFHEALDLRANGFDVQFAILDAMESYDDCIATEDIEIEKATAYSLLKAYFWRWEDTDEQIETIASELSFELPIENPVTGDKHKFTIAGKIDRIIRLPDGRLAIMEHKTTSDDLDPGGNYFKRLRIDLQISIYTLAAKMLGYPVETILYNVVRKPTTKPKQLTQAQTKHLIETGDYQLKIDGKELTAGSYEVNYNETGLAITVNDAPAETTKGARGVSIQETLDMFSDRVFVDMCRRYNNFFSRREIARLNSDIAQTKLTIWQYAQMIERCLDENCWPMNDDSCVGFGTCEYFDLCTSGFDAFTDTHTPEGFIKVDDVHQELITSNTKG